MESRDLVILDRRSIKMTESPMEPFFPNDVKLGEIELRIEGPQEKYLVQPRHRPCVIVGRSADCDIVLDDEDVGYRHAYLQLCAGHLFCIYLDNRSGSRRETIPRKSGWLTNRDRISIGSFSIAVEFMNSASAESTMPPTADLMKPAGLDDLQSRPVELRFLNGRHANKGNRIWEIQQPITLIGRSKKCRLRLKDKSVSAVHCSLFATAAGLWIIDLLGRDGVFVNQRQVSFHLLDEGDEILIGKYRFGIHYPDRNGRRDDTEFSMTDDLESPSFSGEQPPPAALPTNSGMSEDFVLSLMDRFAAMQEQMAVMSQQQMTMMTQLVGTMHQSHHEVVQAEMARISEIGKQIDALREELADRDAESSTRISAAASDVARVENTPQTAFPKAARPMAALPMSEEIAETSMAEDDVFPLDDSLEADTAAADSEVAPPASAVESPENVAGDAESSTFKPRDVDSHARLIENMATLERERKSRWSKVMRVLRGAKP